MLFNPRSNKDDRRIFSLCLSMIRNGVPNGVLALINMRARSVIESEKVKIDKLCGKSSLSKGRRAARLAICSFCYRTNCVGDYRCLKSRLGPSMRFEKAEWVKHGKSSSLFENETPVCSPSLRNHIEDELNRVEYS
nr:putative nucleic acid-binding protein [Cherry mottle leaf virus]UCJ00366.1 putative nucleic acid-binding protein [Cherry mottle leaf virus]